MKLASVCALEQTDVYDKPFGGIHTLLTGDFYQMKTMGKTPIIVEIHIYRDKVEAKLAREIFTKTSTHFVVLTVNDQFTSCKYNRCCK